MRIVKKREKRLKMEIERGRKFERRIVRKNKVN